MPLIDTSHLPDDALDETGDASLAVFTRAATDAKLRDGAFGGRPLFLAESAKTANAALNAGVRPFAMLLEKKWHAAAEPLVRRVLEAYPGVAVHIVGPGQFERITGYATTRGALLAMERPTPAAPDAVLGTARRIAVLEDVNNYANIGAIFRSATAFGIDGILLNRSCHDPLFRRAARVSQGAVFHVPWARIGSERAWAAEGVELLHQAGFEVAALALRDDAVPLDDARLAAADRLALVLGAEGDGLDPRTIACCDWTVIIPMMHDVDSLNVAAASAVAFWELRAR